MIPDSTPNAACSTFAIGARQLVVQGTGTVREHVFGWVNDIVVDAEHDRRDIAVGGSRDDDLARSHGEVLAAAGRVGEPAGGPDDDIDIRICAQRGAHVATGRSGRSR